ncbi:MAG: cobyrinate a,c-diamide synthase [Dehalococcoidia bacterium]|nr:cobyrinate a,c-diamide synthase [Dehalococcoidia bacterium]MDZ4245562.1 cobyrinate a,c-diamide synthase [Dehalococcoidia bacterium]
MVNKKRVNLPRVLIAGLSSGCGKTTVSSGIMAALRHTGLKVQGYKVGPDYIDPGYHTLATGRPSRNLDSWMLSHETVRELFMRSSGSSDIAVIEGVMGLFDGHSGADDRGSSAEVAKILKTPVILVLDIARQSRSAAASVLGCLHFDPALDIKGVILNNAGSERHWQWVKEAVEQNTGVPVLGHLPRSGELKLPERHLGLVPVAEEQELENILHRIREKISACVDVDRVREIASAAPLLPAVKPGVFPSKPVSVRTKIGVAMDEAFSFYYRDNLDLLEAHGAELAAFSPLRDENLPAGVQGLYFGGGFPELYAGQLSKNELMRRCVKQAGLNGMAVYAECGGLMYLAGGLTDFQGNKHPMVGLVPGWSEIAGGRLRLAYVSIEGQPGNPLVNSNDVIRGHEFHYSSLVQPDPTARSAWKVLEPDARAEGYLVQRTIASYIHLHFATHHAIASNFVSWCAGNR